MRGLGLALCAGLLAMSGCGTGGGATPGDSDSGDEFAVTDMADLCGRLSDRDASELMGREVRLKTSESMDAASCRWVPAGDNPAMDQGLQVIIGHSVSDLDQAVDALGQGENEAERHDLVIDGVPAALVVHHDGGVTIESVVTVRDGLDYVALVDLRERDDVTRVADAALTVIMGGELPDGSASTLARLQPPCRGMTSSVVRRLVGGSQRPIRGNGECRLSGPRGDVSIKAWQTGISASEGAESMVPGAPEPEQLTVPGVQDAWLDTEGEDSAVAYGDIGDATWRVMAIPANRSGATAREMALATLAALAALAAT